MECLPLSLEDNPDSERAQCPFGQRLSVWSLTCVTENQTSINKGQFYLWEHAHSPFEIIVPGPLQRLDAPSGVVDQTFLPGSENGTVVASLRGDDVLKNESVPVPCENHLQEPIRV